MFKILSKIISKQCDQIWRFFAILAIFGGFWRQFFCQKSPLHKSFDVDILAFKKLVYVLWRQIWRFSAKCWRFFRLNTWSHCKHWLFVLQQLQNRKLKSKFCSKVSNFLPNANVVISLKSDMSATKRKRSNDSSSSDDNEARFAEAVDPVFHGKLYGTQPNGI